MNLTNAQIAVLATALAQAGQGAGGFALTRSAAEVLDFLDEADQADAQRHTEQPDPLAEQGTNGV